MNSFAVKPSFSRGLSRGLWRDLSCAVLLLMAAACTTKKQPVTQIVVAVDSDLSVPTELDTLKVEVTGAVNMPSAQADLTQQALPRSLSLVHSGGPLGPVTVTVSGLRGASVVVTREAKVSFVQDQSLQLRVFLGRACAGSKDNCASAGKTCDNGQCIDPTIANLPTFGGDVVPFGRGGDGAVDAAHGGGGNDGGADASMSTPDSGTTPADSGTPPVDGSATTPDTGTPTNAPPVCTINAPQDGDSFNMGATISFQGSCNDPESGTLTTGLSWTSSLDGALAMRASFTRNNLSVGTHSITLCARDPLKLTLQGCSSPLSITIGAALPAITATISSLQQNGSSTQPFATGGGAITVMGTGTGATPLTLSWKDSISGALGTGASVMLAAPVAGKHVVTLTVVDAQSRSATTSSTFSVLGGGQTQLISPYTNVNTTVAGNGSAVVPLVAAISSTVYAADTLQHVYGFDGTMLAANATLMVNHPPLTEVVQALAFDVTNKHAYLGTKGGYQVCDFAVSTGIDSTTCMLFNGTNGGNSLPSVDIRAIVRLGSSLLVGTSNGLFSTTTIAGSSTGTKRLNGIEITALAVRMGTTAYIGSNGNGIYHFDPMNGGQTRNFTMGDGLPSDNVRAVAVNEAGDAVWIATDAGIARYNPSNDNITVWKTNSVPAPGLGSNDVRDIKVTRSTINSITRDVIWIATSAGVSRFDPSIPSFTTFTVADGLPSNSVRSITFVNGTKVFATDGGVALYTGL